MRLDNLEIEAIGENKWRFDGCKKRSDWQLINYGKSLTAIRHNGMSCIHLTGRRIELLYEKNYSDKKKYVCRTAKTT